jgi:molecular chaperone GrpE
MSDRPQTVDRSQTGGAAAAGGGAQPEGDSARARQDDARAQADGREPSSPGASARPGSADAAQAGGDAHARQTAEAPAGDADEDALRGDVDELVAVAAQRDDYLALAQRTQADFENYRKRVAKELASAQERGVVRLAEELLPALDNLDRAIEEGTAAAEREEGDAPLLEGVRLVRSELHAALARMGIECFSPRGATFDPAEHEAMAQKPIPGSQSGTVAEVLQPGYRLGKSIIRPARVVVAA